MPCARESDGETKRATLIHKEINGLQTFNTELYLYTKYAWEFTHHATPFNSLIMPLLKLSLYPPALTIICSHSQAPSLSLYPSLFPSLSSPLYSHSSSLHFSLTRTTI